MGRRSTKEVRIKICAPHSEDSASISVDEAAHDS